MNKVKNKIQVFLLLAALTLATVLPFGSATVSAAPAGYDNASARTYQILNEFVTAHPDRTVGTPAEKAAALFLAQKFYDMKLPAYSNKNEAVDFAAASENKPAEYEKYLTLFSGRNQKNEITDSHNVAAYLEAENETDKVVIIGAHYDDVYAFVFGDSTRKSNGAYDNGTGVAVMLALAERFVLAPPKDVNIIFAAFGSEETGLYGSEAFVTMMKTDQNKSKDFKNTLIMFNLDVVGAGDHMYLYTDEVTTGHGNYLHDVAKSAGIGLKRPPADKKILLAPGAYNLPYSHVGQMSDHASFYNEGLNVAFFFTMNWDTYSKTGAVESTRHEAVMHTANDTLAKLNEYYADTYVKYMDNAVTIIEQSVRKEGFVSAMESAIDSRPNYSFWTNGLYLTLISLGILIVIIGVILLLYFKYRKKAASLPTQDEPTVPGAAKQADPFYIFGEGLDGKHAHGQEREEPGDDSPFGKDFEEK